VLADVLIGDTHRALKRGRVAIRLFNIKRGEGVDDTTFSLT